MTIIDLRTFCSDDIIFFLIGDGIRLKKLGDEQKTCNLFTLWFTFLGSAIIEVKLANEDLQML